MIEHVLALRYSKDGGHNWTPWRQVSLGTTGQFLFPVELTRFGRAAQEFIFELAISTPMQRDLMAASWKPEQVG
ncbi:hypothetical protein ACHZ97_14610 [Lysobacter soli]|uniref:hypothetical protein n=1 Tax=Lysobacter soli TaxID=453783 RepID=UPI0037CB5A97